MLRKERGYAEKQKDGGKAAVRGAEEQIKGRKGKTGKAADGVKGSQTAGHRIDGGMGNGRKGELHRTGDPKYRPALFPRGDFGEDDGGGKEKAFSEPVFCPDPGGGEVCISGFGMDGGGDEPAAARKAGREGI